MRKTLALLLSLAAVHAAGQQPSIPSHPAKPPAARPTSPGAEDSAAVAVPIPSVTLAFKEQDAIPGAPSSSAWMAPIQCGSDGVPVVAFFNQTNQYIPDLTALDPGGAIAYHLGSATGLYDIHFMGFFVSDSVVAAQVNATRDSTKKSVLIRSDLPSQEMYTGKHSSFILEFDRKGTYKQTIELPAEYEFMHMALLPDDTFVAIAYDEVNSVPRLLLLDSSGEIIRPLEIPQQMENDPALVKGQSGDSLQRAHAFTSLSWWLFAEARGKVLLYQAHAHSPVVEIGPAGARREVPLTSPPGYSLNSVVASDDRWIMRFLKDGLNLRGGIDGRPQTHNFVYYEVDPYDGSLKRRIDLPDNAPDPACERDGVVVSFTPSDGKIIPLAADLAH